MGLSAAPDAARTRPSKTREICYNRPGGSRRGVNKPLFCNLHKTHGSKTYLCAMAMFFPKCGGNLITNSSFGAQFSGKFANPSTHKQSGLRPSVSDRREMADCHWLLSMTSQEGFPLSMTSQGGFPAEGIPSRGKQRGVDHTRGRRKEGKDEDRETHYRLKMIRLPNVSLRRLRQGRYLIEIRTSGA